jgi:Hypothetical glycosyl hydrolase family 15
MRRGVNAAALALALLASGCLGGSAATVPPPPTCATSDPPAIALTIEPATAPGPARAACLAATYTNVVGSPSWGSVPKRFAAANPSVHTWQTRVLQYGFTPCEDCPQPGLDLAQVRRDHPEWILRDASGAEVHPLDHPDWVLFDFGNVDFQAAWAANVVNDLSKGGWTGVELVDGGNQQEWSVPPIDPRTGVAMTDADRALYLAQALEVVRGGLKTNGFSVVADNGPATVVDSAQIASTDAVTLRAGFAGRAGIAWTTLFEYFAAAVDVHVGAWVQDIGPLNPSERVFGLASYLLVSGPQSSYGVDEQVASDPLYRLNLGQPVDVPIKQNGIWTREFDSGSVAVNPGALDVTVTLHTGGPITVPAGSAVIVVNGHIYSSAR